MSPFSFSGEFMAVETFKWKVERNVTPSIEYRVIETRFGDGYTQLSADGINTKDVSYSIRVHARTNEAKQIMDFFDRHKGIKSFFWTPPLDTIGLFTCRDPSWNDEGGGLYSITGTFTKAYASTGA